MVYVKDVSTGQYVADNIYEPPKIPEHIKRIIFAQEDSCKKRKCKKK